MLGLVLILLSRCFANTLQISEQDYRTKAHDLFLVVERAARLQGPQQEVEIPRIYRDAWPTLEREMRVSTTGYSSLTRNVKDEENLTPEGMAEVLDREGGWPLVRQVALARCRALLSAHATQVEDLAREDLKSNDQDRVLRGLRATGEFNLHTLYDETVAQLDGPGASFAGYALRELNDARAIHPLVQHGIALHFEVLRRLQRGRPAHPDLVALLDDRNPEVRWRAAYALAESGDPLLAPVVKRLVQDEASTVRLQGAAIAASLPPDAFLRVRPVLVKLLTDKAVDVRSDVVIMFATRKDSVCATALYNLLAQEETLEPWRQSNLVQALNSMTGSYFGFNPGTTLTESARQASLRSYAQWISENTRPSRRIEP